MLVQVCLGPDHPSPFKSTPSPSRLHLHTQSSLPAPESASQPAYPTSIAATFPTPICQTPQPDLAHSQSRIHIRNGATIAPALQAVLRHNRAVWQSNPNLILETSTQHAFPPKPRRPRIYHEQRYLVEVFFPVASLQSSRLSLQSAAGCRECRPCPHIQAVPCSSRLRGVTFSISPCRRKRESEYPGKCICIPAWRCGA